MSAITYDDLVDMAREAVSWEVNNLDGGTVGIEGLLDVAREGIREGVDAQLIYTADIVATWMDLEYPDLPEWERGLDTDLSSMVRTATYWALVDGEDLGPDAACDGMDQALTLRAREHAVDMGADDVDEYLASVIMTGDMREPLWDYLNGGDVDDLRVALGMVAD